jgi:hypothetical protein
MGRYFVITWRTLGGDLYFFRGDNRYEIFLPFISAGIISKGWVREEEYARVFNSFPVFTGNSFAKNFPADRLKVYPYEKEIMPTQIVRPTHRPRNR